jgi:uncharacterized protein YceH (UPF0502 family)
MHRFEDLTEVQSTLQRLMQRDPPLARVLPRQPGTKEARYKHLLAEDVEDDGVAVASVARVPSPATVASSSAEANRIIRLENEVTDLRREVADLKQQLATFRKQFES